MIKANIDAFKRFLLGRTVAYNRVFDKQSPFTAQVLTDLAKFCRAHDSTFHKDPRVHAMLEGRREVWLRIQEHLQMDVEDVYKLHRIKNLELGE